MKVEFCEHNNGHKDVIKMIKKDHPDYEIEVHHCIGLCDKCQAKYIARIGNEYLSTEESTTLYKQITSNKKALETHNSR